MKKVFIFLLLSVFGGFQSLAQSEATTEDTWLKLWTSKPSAAHEDWSQAQTCGRLSVGPFYNATVHYFPKSGNLFIEDDWNVLAFLKNEAGENVYLGWDKNTEVSLKNKQSQKRLIEALADNTKNTFFLMISGMGSQSPWQTLISDPEDYMSSFVQGSRKELLDELKANDDTVQELQQLLGLRFQFISISNKDLVLQSTDKDGNKQGVVARCDLW